jgi:hypothetical protein
MKKKRMNEKTRPRTQTIFINYYLYLTNIILLNISSISFHSYLSLFSFFYSTFPFNLKSGKLINKYMFYYIFTFLPTFYIDPSLIGENVYIFSSISTKSLDNKKHDGRSKSTWKCYFQLQEQQ